MRRKSRGPRENADVLPKVREHLRAAGYSIVEKTHGNRYMKGWPDLYCFGRFGERAAHLWVEVKAPKGSLTARQKTRFAEWEAAGLTVLVATLNESGHVVFSGWRSWA